MASTFEGRSRVVTLVYKVITDFVLPDKDLSDAAIYGMLGAAFYRKAAEVVDEEWRPTNGADHPSSSSFITLPPVEK